MTAGLVNAGARTLRRDELRAAIELFRQSLLEPPLTDESWDRAVDTFDPDRSFAVTEPGPVGAADHIIATTRSFPTRTAVPGGAVLGLAAVTAVGVRADRTRRGLMSALMRAVLDDAAARGEPLAGLHASDTRLYGRFGYGVATRSRSVTVRGTRGWRPTPAVGEVRLLDRDAILSVLPDLHGRLALRRAGGIEREAGWWEYSVGRALREREGILAAVHSGPAGDEGYALARIREGGELRLDDLVAADTAAAAGLWRFLVGVDLVKKVTADLRPVDEPLELLLTDPREVTVSAVEDELWLRLVDVPAALAARTFGRLDPILLAVHDPWLPANAGVYRIAHGTAERVEPLGGPVAPELECDAAALAMAYLGDRRPSELAATGWWTAHDPDALERADAAFATREVPWCGTMF